MDLHLKNKLFIVTGASSGFGKAIASMLSQEEASVIAVARGMDKLRALKEEHPAIEVQSLDITQPESLHRLVDAVGERDLNGIVVNAGGPPAKAFLETNMEDWDQAYRQVLRWKVDLAQTFLPLFEKNNYGRYLFIESISVKQPIPNLVLSTSLRMAVIGFVKTLSEEIALKGITANVMAPGMHLTPALERLIQKNSEVDGISFEEAREKIIDEVPVKKTGNVDDFGSLALWLLSSWSSYITGQTISVDGGAIRGAMG
jgi:3-oxoacyl-[acyl-carrier protein] reductase